MKKSITQTNKDLDLRRFGKDVYSKALDEGGGGGGEDTVSILQFLTSKIPSNRHYYVFVKEVDGEIVPIYGEDSVSSGKVTFRIGKPLGVELDNGPEFASGKITNAVSNRTGVNPQVIAISWDESYYRVVGLGAGPNDCYISFENTAAGSSIILFKYIVVIGSTAINYSKEIIDGYSYFKVIQTSIPE